MKLLYYFIYSVLYLFSLLPMRVHYCISDGFYLLIYYVIGYRRKVVRSNLTSSFPEKSAEEIRQIERGFFKKNNLKVLILITRKRIKK